MPEPTKIGHGEPPAAPVQYGVRLVHGDVVSCVDRQTAEEFLGAYPQGVLVQHGPWVDVEGSASADDADLKARLLALRKEILQDPALTRREVEDLKAAVLLLIMHLNHRAADRG